MSMDSWVLEQVKARGPASGMEQMHVQALVDALRALRRGEGQLFGMGLSSVVLADRAAVDQAVVDQLVAWKQHFDAAKDAVAAEALGEVAASFGIDALNATRAPLKCDPLGTRDGLSKEWLSILSRLDEAVAGTRALNLEAVHVVGAEFGKPVRFGAPDLQKLYKLALLFERELGKTFPREIAAFWNTANGIYVDDVPLLVPVDQWNGDNDAMRIGCGGYFQGRLLWKNPGARWFSSKVVDLDDDGDVRAKYASFAAFAEALLGK